MEMVKKFHVCLNEMVVISPRAAGSRLGASERGSPSVLNGPMGGASPRAGLRRQQAESPDPSAERGRSARLTNAHWLPVAGNFPVKVLTFRISVLDDDCTNMYTLLSKHAVLLYTICM